MRRNLIHLGFVVMFAIFILVVSGPQQALAVTPKSATGTIAYVVPNDTTGDQIWLVQPDGSNNRKIYQTGKSDPHGVYAISSLSWRPDSGELVFASNHEDTCSVYASDLYSIRGDGSGYRRITNGPACAVLASYPATSKGTVRMSSYGYSPLYLIYVMGAPGAVSAGGTVDIQNVYDYGSNKSQPVVVIDGDYRWRSTPVEVQAGQNVYATVATYGWGSDEIGAYKPVWHRDGSRLGYAEGCISLYSIADQPTEGTPGQVLFNMEGISPCVMAWGSTASTASDFVYSTSTNTYDINGRGIYLTSENSPNPPEKLISTDAWVFGMQYLPDASGLIITMTDTEMTRLGDSSSIYRYDFASHSLTQLTYFTKEYVRDFALSSDGRSIIFERAPKQDMTYFGGASDLWVMGIDGSNLHRLITGGAHPSWSLGAVTSTGTSLPYKVYLPLTIRK